MNTIKKTTAFYEDSSITDDIKTYCAFTNRPYSHIINEALLLWKETNIDAVKQAIEKQKEIDKIIESYKNKDE